MLDLYVLIEAMPSLKSDNNQQARKDIPSQGQLYIGTQQAQA
jgi:hypothetical protein